MNVLYLTDPALDYLADQIYTGLCKVLGWQNIFDFPQKAAYHDPAARAAYLPQNPGHDASFDDLVCRIRDHRVDLGARIIAPTRNVGGVSPVGQARCVSTHGIARWRG